MRSKRIIITSLSLVFILLIITIAAYFLNNSDSRFSNRSEVETSNAESIQTESISSYPVSYSSIFYVIQTLGTDKIPEWYESPDFDYASDSEISLEFRYPTAYIGQYYSNISSKHYEKAMQFGIRGRTLEEYKAIYDDVDEISVSSIIDKGNNTYTANVFLLYKDKLIKEYKVDIKLSAGLDYIESSTAQELINQKYYLDCRYSTAQINELCIFRREDGSVVKLFRHGISNYALLRPGYSISEDEIYIVASGGGDDGYATVFIYNFKTFTIKPVEFLFYHSPYHNVEDPTINNESCPIHALDNYRAGGCLYEKYGNEEWVIQTFYFIDNLPKYINFSYETKKNSNSND